MAQINFVNFISPATKSGSRGLPRPPPPPLILLRLSAALVHRHHPLSVACGTVRDPFGGPLQLPPPPALQPRHAAAAGLWSTAGGGLPKSAVRLELHHRTGQHMAHEEHPWGRGTGDHQASAVPRKNFLCCGTLRHAAACFCLHMWVPTLLWEQTDKADRLMWSPIPSQYTKKAKICATIERN